MQTNFTAYPMAPRKHRCPKVDEYAFDSSEDEHVQCGTPPSVLHPHVHVKSLNGRVSTQQSFYNMPSSPEPPVTETQANVTGSSPLGDDNVNTNVFNDIPDVEDSDQAEENNAEKTRTTVELSVCLTCHCNLDV